MKNYLHKRIQAPKEFLDNVDLYSAAKVNSATFIDEFRYPDTEAEKKGGVDDPQVNELSIGYSLSSIIIIGIAFGWALKKLCKKRRFTERTKQDSISCETY
jgi:hypothetical protein